MLTDHWRFQPPSTSPSFGVDVQGWQRSRADDCIHTSAHSQRSRQAERKLHILSARVFILANCTLSATICSSERNMPCVLAGALTFLYSYGPRMLFVPQYCYKLVEYNKKSFYIAADFSSFNFVCSSVRNQMDSKHTKWWIKQACFIYLID